MKFRILAALLAPFWLANCATVVDGTDQNVLVTSEPTGAACMLSRDGGQISAVAATPGNVNLDKSKDPITVACAKDGHLDTTATLKSGFRGTTFGNILLGGIIGVAIDAGSGAMNEYPSSITVYLPPESFPSEEERDAYFDKRVATIEADAAAAKKKIVTNCAEDSGENLGCQSQQKKVDEERDRQVQNLESQRATAGVSS